jgi:hypothetical protein
MDPFESVVKPTDSFSEKKIIINYQLHVFGEKSISNNQMYSSFHFLVHNNFREWDLLKLTHILKFKDHKLLCCLHSLLKEKPDFSYKLMKIKLRPFPIQVHGHPEIRSQVKTGCRTRRLRNVFKRFGRSWAFKTAKIQSVIFLFLPPSGLKHCYQRFGEKECLHLQSRMWKNCLDARSNI